MPKAQPQLRGKNHLTNKTTTYLYQGKHEKKKNNLREGEWKPTT